MRDHRPRPLWFWNGPLDEAVTREAIRQMDEQSGYGGFAVLPAPGMTPAFQGEGAAGGAMNDAFLDHYRVALDEAAKRGMKACLYDEFWFPSGAAGGLLAKVHPDAVSRHIEMDAVDIRGPKRIRRRVKAATPMAAIAMDRATFERRDLTDSIREGHVEFDLPAGSWRVMIFTCVVDGRDGLVDYLDGSRVAKFVELTYQRYFAAFGEHFGKTIDSAFYDEPCLYRVHKNGNWTESFNDVFEKRHGLCPRSLYPALLFDIGPDTAWARNLLFETRNAMFADAFVGTLARWCDAHGIVLTGHYDQEEVVNPTNLAGDLILGFQHQHIPGVDQIFEYGRGSAAFKIVSSAATLFNRDRVMIECYGGIKAMPVENLYREAIDLFAKGVNLMVPHAVWYDPHHVVFEPELSANTEPYASALPAYKAFVKRLHEAFAGTRLVTDVGLLYPIQSLRAGYFFDLMDQYQGGQTPVEADYQEVAEMLSRQARADFLYVHPDLLKQQARVADGQLFLDGTALASGLRVLILPGGDVIGTDVLKIAMEFVRAGGTLIATTRLPTRSAERGQDEAVRQLVAGLFGDDGQGRSHDGGGTTQFIRTPTATLLSAALDRALPAMDVRMEVDGADDTLPASGGSVMYCHRRGQAGELLFVGNTQTRAVTTRIRMRDGVGPQAVMTDPSTGRALPIEHAADGKSFKLSLPANACRLIRVPRGA